MDLTTIPLVSADAHVDEPHDLWFDRLPEHLRDRAPRRLATDDDGGWNLVIDGSTVGWVDRSSEEARDAEEARWSHATPEHRLAIMDTDTVAAEMIYPTIGLYVWGIADAEVGRRCCRIYNDWIADQLVGISPRIRCAAMLPTPWGVDETIAEARRVADAGFAALMIPLVGTPEWNLPDWEPFWRAVGELGLPVAMHQGSGHDMIFYRGWGSPTANLLATQSMAPRAAALLSCSGVLERHPGVHAAMVEVNASWLAWSMSTLDEYHAAHRHWSKPTLAEPPSFYIRRQVHATFQTDRVALDNLGYTGDDSLMWGNDYPHPEGIYPKSRQTVVENFAGVAPAAAAKLLHGNAVRVFGFDPAVIDG